MKRVVIGYLVAAAATAASVPALGDGTPAWEKADADARLFTCVAMGLAWPLLPVVVAYGAIRRAVAR